MYKRAFIQLMVLVIGSLTLPGLVSADVRPSGCAAGSDGLPDPSCNSASDPNFLINDTVTHDIRSLFSDNVNGECFKYAELTIKDVDFTNNSDMQITGGEDFVFQFCKDRKMRFTAGGAESGTIEVRLAGNECYISGAGVASFFGSSCTIKYNPSKFGGCQCAANLRFSPGFTDDAGRSRGNEQGSILFGSDGKFLDSSFTSADRTVTSLLTSFAPQVASQLTNYSCPVIDDYSVGPTLVVDITSCEAQQKQDACCCKVEEQGSLSKKYTCSKQNILPGASCDFLGPGEYKKLTIDSAGNCDSYSRTETANYQASGSSGFTIGDKKLIDEAKKLNKLGTTNVNDMIGRVARGLMAFMGMILFVLYIYAGLLWMLASGNDEQITKSKNILVWSTLGVAVMMGSYIIVQFIFSTTLKL